VLRPCAQRDDSEPQLWDCLHLESTQGTWFGALCYLAEDGTAYGMCRDRLAQLCRECDVYFNLSNINWIPELEQCRCRVLVEYGCSPRSAGLGGPFSQYHVLFTYGENIHRPGEMPTGWALANAPAGGAGSVAGEGRQLSAPFTTVMNWSAYEVERVGFTGKGSGI